MGASLNLTTQGLPKILLGSDQLTAARIRGTQALCQSNDKASNRLEGPFLSLKTGMSECLI